MHLTLSQTQVPGRSLERSFLRSAVALRPLAVAKVAQSKTMPMHMPNVLQHKRTAGPDHKAWTCISCHHACTNQQNQRLRSEQSQWGILQLYISFRILLHSWAFNFKPRGYGLGVQWTSWSRPLIWSRALQQQNTHPHTQKVSTATSTAVIDKIQATTGCISFECAEWVP